jgi:uncharacterized protein (TIGR02145 family)
MGKFAVEWAFKRAICFALCAVLAGVFAPAAAQTVGGVEAVQVGTNLEIRYTLDAPAVVSVWLSEDSGTSWTQLSTCLSGDYGKVTSAGRKVAVWDVLSCRESLVGSRLHFKVRTGKPDPCAGAERVTFDGYDYRTVAIGNQCWFAENLRSDNYLNGDVIPGNYTKRKWRRTTDGVQAICEENPENLAVFGRLYNWYAVDDVRGLCPSGWHVPSIVEWRDLFDRFGYFDASKQLKSADCNEAEITDFSGSLSGFRNNWAFYSGVGTHSLWWSTTRFENGAWARVHDTESKFVGQEAYYLGNGFSVRCVRDSKQVVAFTSVFDSLEAVESADLLTACDCLEASKILFNTYADLTAQYKEAIDAYIEAERSGAEPPVDVSEKIESEVKVAFAIVEEKGLEIGEVCEKLINIPSVLEGTDSADCPNVEAVRVAYSRAIGDEVGVQQIKPCTGAERVTFDGYDYRTVAIGDQCWFAENLRSDNYRSGAAIPGNLTNSQWTNTINGAQAVYDNDSKHLSSYGRLYNWYAVKDARGLCPSGWHVPSDEEWTALTEALGGEAVAGGQMNFGGLNDLNSDGFAALPGGFRYSNTGRFGDLSYIASWWSSTPSDSYAWSRGVGTGLSFVSRQANDVRFGFSVRCVRD